VDLNIVSDNKGAGIGVFEQAAPTIQNNQCYGNEAGILIDQGTNPVLLGNDCYDNLTEDILDYR
jgi:parallel beta-helix repeat protein